MSYLHSLSKRLNDTFHQSQLVQLILWFFRRLFRTKIFGKLCIRKVSPIDVDFNIFDLSDLKTISNIYFSRIIKDANLIYEGNYSLFSNSIKEVKIILYWRKDYIFDYEWPLIDSQKLRLKFREGVDIKNVWELNRLQFLPIVGLAYYLTQNKKYYVFVKNILSDWISKNPIYLGPNWMNAMEPAIRSVNIILTLSLCKNMLEDDEEFFAQISNSLYQHGLFIYRNREIGITGIKSNHFLSDLLGLLFIGIVFRSTPKGKKWIDYSIREFEKAINEQVYEDGINFEHSTSYHRFVLEIFIYAYLVMNENNLSITEHFKNKLDKMFRFVELYTRPDGKAVQAGDTDDGRVAIFNNYFDWDRRDHNYLIQIGSTFLTKRKANITFNLQDIIGDNSVDTETIVIDNNITKGKDINVAKLYEKPGVLIIKDELNYLFLTAWKVGTNGIGNHQHNDIFSFELAINGESFIVDPGCFNYTGFPDMRNLFRSTAYHNTIRIDGKEINPYSKEKLFRMSDKAKPKILFYEENAKQVVFEAEHYGYSKLPQPVIHKRMLVYDKVSKRFEIVDNLVGKGKHLLESYFHLDQDVLPILDKNKVYLNKNNSSICIELLNKDLLFELEKGFISRSYFQKNGSYILKLHILYDSQIKIHYKIYKVD